MSNVLSMSVSNFAGLISSRVSCHERKLKQIYAFHYHTSSDTIKRVDASQFLVLMAVVWDLGGP